MNLLTDQVKKVYFKYLSASFGSALIASIYGIVDMAVVGQYHGPSGTAAMAVTAPVWNMIYSLGLLMGSGGAVLFSTLRGDAQKDKRSSDEYFSAAVMGGGLITLIVWLGVIFFDKPLLILFGADETLLPLAQRYLMPVKFAVPAFLFTQLLSAFLRNDGNPSLATKAVVISSVFNMFADYFFVFTLDMGAFGAGLATALGGTFSLAIVMTHFFSRKNTIQWVRPRKLLKTLGKIVVTGFSTFFIDVAMGILTMFFNRQIMRYLGGDALAVYGVIVNISTFVQCCSYSVGQAAQPIISMNYGAGKGERIEETLKYALLSVTAFSIFWTALSLCFPKLYVYIFMTPTDEVLLAAPGIIRLYSLSFLLLPFNIFSTYYFQALLKPNISFVVSVARGIAISGLLIYLLPWLAGADSLWLAMPITELCVAVFVAVEMIACTKKLKGADLPPL